VFVATALVTGANRGIGLELCRQLRERGDEVLAACRRSSPELERLDVKVHTGVDVSDDGAVNRLAEALAGVKLDLLINNAGILTRESLEELDFGRLRRQFEVNSLGVLRVTTALLGNLHAGSKIAIITSLMGSLADNASGRSYGYRMSKAAVNMAGVCLARDLAERGITVLLLHPGRVATEMTGRQGTPVQDSVRGLVARIDALGPEASGTFWHARGEPLPW
jgi:NAD(P)-dependent dehydrogenase (short-subunit alcohol dehydrogenase family)